MPILTSEEEKIKLTRKKEFKDAAMKFKGVYLSSLALGLKVGGLSLAGVILLYLIAKWIFRWDLFYETDLEYALIFSVVAFIFLFVVFLCIVVAIILFNTKHKRNTKYSTVNDTRGG